MDPTFRSNWTNLDGQSFPVYNGGPYQNLTMDQQSYYGAHRGSDPEAFARNRQAQDEGLDLSPFDDLARTSVNSVSVHEVIKDEQSGPWISTHQTTSQQRQLPQIQGCGSYARTEPPPRQDLYSDSADSGYETQCHKSVALAHSQYGWDKQEQIRSLDSYGLLSAQKANFDSKTTVSDDRVVRASRDARRKPPLEPCQFPGCGRVPNNQSDANKHRLTHTRPFRCTEPDCRREKGFATDNDLQRHRKSVHKLRPTVGNPAGYVCVACSVSKDTSPKFWPRKDNFRAHIKRKHPQFDEEDLLKRSKQMTRPENVRIAEEDEQTVASALQSVAPQSQIDPDEGQAYEQFRNSPGLSRHASDQGNYSSNLWPPSGSPMFNSDEVLAGMHGHTANLSQYGFSSSGSSGANGLYILPDPLDNFNVPKYPSYAQLPPFKRLKTAHFEDMDAFVPTQQEHAPNSGETQTTSSSSGPQSTLSPPPSPEHYKCPQCPKVRRRECDLKKHMKRHTRPYGCTHPNCQKKFGSRNDWKRHESTQHTLQEMWKCRRKRADGTDCMRRPFYSLELLKKHLEGAEHQMYDEAEIETQCEENRLGRDGFTRFWCGFCVELISQPDQFISEEKGTQNGPDERFKHIGDHFDKDRRDSGEWVCIYENKKKKYITAEERKEGKRRAKFGFREDEKELPNYLESNAFAVAHLPDEISSHKRKHFEIDDGPNGLDL